nr:copia protein [Tanacetum cinerariifolium]
MKVEESLNVTFDETPPSPETSPLEDDDLVDEEAIEVNKTKPLGNDLEDKLLENNEIINIKESKIHPLDNFIACQEMCDDFAKIMHDEFEMSMMGELNFFLDKRIFRYIKGTTHLGLWYPKGSGIETIVYVESDHAGDYMDRKSTSGICTFVGCYLTSWFSKKRTALAISTTEAEYVSAEKACQQALWMKQSLVDYGIRVAKISVRPIWRKKLNYCNTSNEVDVNLPTPMPKLKSPLKESSQENPPTTFSNHDSLQPHSLSLGDYCDTNVRQAFIPPQSVDQTQLTQTLFPHLLINPHVASVLHAQSPSSPQGDNQTQRLLSPSPSREMLMNDINQLQDLSNLLAMHLS